MENVRARIVCEWTCLRPPSALCTIRILRRRQSTLLAELLQGGHRVHSLTAVEFDSIRLFLGSETINTSLLE